jgi:biotin carboxyl carrier protein
VSEGGGPAIEVRPLGGGRYLVVVGDRCSIAYAACSAAGTWVHFDGQVHLTPVPDAGALPLRQRAVDDASLMSPMPAAVVAVHVEPNQRVATGDLLITLEAMKMELAIRAPRDGIVGAVHCQPGDLVEPGVVLVDLAPA